MRIHFEAPIALWEKFSLHGQQIINGVGECIMLNLDLAFLSKTQNGLKA
jgi:hypothetical protein